MLAAVLRHDSARTASRACRATAAGKPQKTLHPLSGIYSHRTQDLQSGRVLPAAAGGQAR